MSSFLLGDRCFLDRWYLYIYFAQRLQFVVGLRVVLFRFIFLVEVFCLFWLFCFVFCLVGVWGFFFAIALLLAFIKNCVFCTGGVEGWEF